MERMRVRQRKVREARARNRVRELMKTRGYAVCRKLRTRSEHVVAEGKTCHGLGRARRRGLGRAQDQATLTAVVQNLKRLVGFVGRKKWGAAAAAQAGRSWNRAVLGPCIRPILAIWCFLADQKAHGPSGWPGPGRSTSQLRAVAIPIRWHGMARS